MPATLSWEQIALRLALTVLAGLIIGFNRGERGHAAGLRTTVLVCTAAAVAMIQANLLLATTANAEGHTITLDLMRLPLGILSGIGFIGAGAILRRGEMIRGVTTAATMWLTTVIGLCFGGGQIGLGLAASAIAIGTLWVLRHAESYVQKDGHGTLIVELTGGEIEALPVIPLVEEAGFHIQSRRVARDISAQKVRYQIGLSYRKIKDRDPPIDLLRALRGIPGFSSAEWIDLGT